MSKRIPAGNVRLKRAYEAVSAGDVTRVLVDRLWPRGVSKNAAAIDLWLKDLAPSTELRKWFGHDSARWAQFQKLYADEIYRHPQAFEQLRDLACAGVVTLVYSAHDEAHNNAIALRGLLLGSRSSS